ncbi:hypothetical protein SAMN02745119_03356 [Trichlorobacter thiogenes]|uniref:Uncharacterized protein n=1 Tax=Trichlorobacter thiogenes TaxID=115783 RepID=A0A1T4S9W3_9BACT|nr:hypothetical protein [Trichlorobacter thiogenes]SKA25019.1 hypothetical protein SAMN02745119_03356 [Trichlorobacter thiogenes]
MSNGQEKQIIIEEMKLTGFYVGSQISKKTGQQFVTLLSGGKQIKFRALYPSPDANRLIPGTMTTAHIKDVEFIMSDYNSMFIGSREFKVSSAKAPAAPAAA